MVLVNGAEGIGTGWATLIPSYNPLDISSQIKARLEKRSSSFKRLMPWYKNFKGSIEADESNGVSYIFEGNVSK